MSKKVVELKKIVNQYDEREYYYTVKSGRFVKHFYHLEDAERFVKYLDATYEYKEVQVEGCIASI